MTKKLSIKTGLTIFTILTIALTVLSFPELINCKDDVLAASDKEYAISVSGIGVNDDNKDDILGQGNKEAVYYPETNTLELNGNVNCIHHSVPGLTIKVAKDVKVSTEDEVAIGITADTTITGPGKFYVSGDPSVTVCIACFADLTIKDANLDLYGLYGILGNDGDENLTIDNSFIHCRSNKASICYFNGGIEIKDSALLDRYKVSYTDEVYRSGYSVCKPDGQTIAKSIDIIPGYGLTVAGIPVTKSNKSDVLGNGKKEAVYDPVNNIIELNGNIISPENGGIRSYVKDLTIKVNKDVKITCGDDYCEEPLRLEESATITGPGKLILKSEEAIASCCFNGGLKIIDADIECLSDIYGIARESNREPLVIENSYVHATGGWSAIGSVYEGIDLNCVKIAEPAGAKVFYNYVEYYIAVEADTRPTEIKLEPSHNWGEWKVTTKAEVGKKGVETRTCPDCGRAEHRDIPAIEPSATPTATPAPTTAPTAFPTGAAADVTLKIDKETANVVCGKTLTLKATLTGSSEKLSWKTSDKKIATVDANGKISAKMAGAVTVTATAAGKSVECKVTVLYKDVTKSKDFWFAPTNYLTAKGVVKGYDNQTKFKPANKCTRAQMVTFIWRLMGEPAPKAKTCKFKDVKKTDYFYRACIWGNEKKIVEGYKDGTFGPQIVCARRHAVTFLWRLAGQPKPKTTKNPFKDVKKSDYFYKATLWASEKKILAGYSDGTFKPNGDCLRRQMVTFLYKYDKFINGKG
ncbi:MAG: S-layer homology domain-containing protein [Clostridiales bacterium]|nr:S-layer homology domain-containing protein [Clostridiales bacterium]